jgi:hypothetical protein
MDSRGYNKRIATMRFSLTGFALASWCAASTVGLSAASQSWTGPKGNLQRITSLAKNASYRTEKVRVEGFSSLIRLELRGTLPPGANVSGSPRGSHPAAG